MKRSPRIRRPPLNSPAAPNSWPATCSIPYARPQKKGSRGTCPGSFWSKFNQTYRLAMTDRKSTRLNSSHRGISYAVFCLKKILDDVFGPDIDLDQTGEWSSYAFKLLY